MDEYNSAYTGPEIDEAVRKSLADIEDPLSRSGGIVTGAVHLNGGTYLDASTYMKHNVFYNAYGSDGNPCCILGISDDVLYLGSMSSYPHSGSTYIASANKTVALRCGGNAINFAVGGDSPTGSTYRRLTWNTYGESVAYLTCAANGISHLGSSSNKWKNVYATTGTIQTSDRNAKKNIEDMDDRYIQLFDMVRPVTYQLLVGDRIHTGFISQEVEEAMEKVGLTAEELGFFCKDIQVEIVEDEDGKEYQKEVLDENGNPVYIYSLRYEEYIAIMAEKIHRLEARLERLEAALKEETT